VPDFVSQHTAQQSAYIYTGTKFNGRFSQSPRSRGHCSSTPVSSPCSQCCRSRCICTHSPLCTCHRSADIAQLITKRQPREREKERKITHDWSLNERRERKLSPAVDALCTRPRFRMWQQMSSKKSSSDSLELILLSLAASDTRCCRIATLKHTETAADQIDKSSLAERHSHECEKKLRYFTCVVLAHFCYLLESETCFAMVCNSKYHTLPPW
jgi:hypothetical protein